MLLLFDKKKGNSNFHEGLEIIDESLFLYD